MQMRVEDARAGAEPPLAESAGGSIGDEFAAVESAGQSAAVRSLQILEIVARHADGCSLAQLADQAVLPVQTVHRLVAQLQHAGALIREPRSRRVQLGQRMERLAVNALMGGPGRSERHAILQSLVDLIGEPCNLTALSGTEVVYLDRVETDSPLRLMLAPGSLVPAHATSSGKLLLSLLPKARRDRLLAVLPLRRYTETTIVDRLALEIELSKTRERRVGINRGEHLRGMVGVAVPVMVDRQRACAAVALHAPQGRMTVDDLLLHLPRLREAALAIGHTFDAAVARGE